MKYLLLLTLLIPQIVFAQWGVFTPDLKQFESTIGQVDKQAVFSDFSTDFPRVSRPPVIYWEPELPLTDILSGKRDAYLVNFAKAAKAYGKPVIIVLMPEMNGNWSPWDGQHVSPETFIATWRYVRKFFKSPNVQFGWAINARSVPDVPENTIDHYYPGDAYVDLVGVDGFNFGEPWLSWDELFSQPLSSLKAYHKPIWIFSTACTEDPRKALWIDQMAQGLKTYRVQGFIWFNVQKERDWRIDSNPEALQSFKNLLERR